MPRVMSILSSMRYLDNTSDDYTNLWLALGFMPFGLFFDFFDGKVARWRHKSPLMGQELDSLADLVRYASYNSRGTDCASGFLRCLTSSCCVCHWFPNPARPSDISILRAVRLDPISQI